MLAIKDLKTGKIVDMIDGKHSCVTMIEGSLVIVKWLDAATAVMVPSGIDYDIVCK